LTLDVKNKNIELKKLRSELKFYKERVIELDKEKGFLNRKLLSATNRLSDIASGFYPGHYKESWSYDSKLKKSAAECLADLSRMTNL
jgi:hypothetical protein